MKENARKGFGWTVWLAVLLNPVFLLALARAFFFLERLCRAGGLRSNGMKAALWGGLCLAWALIWSGVCLWARRKGRSRRGCRRLWAGALALEAAAAVALSGYYGFHILQSARDMTTKLGGYVYRWQNTETFSLEADNLYEDGLEALFEELDQKLDLPEELYCVRAVEINFQEDGTVTEIYAFLYGEQEGETRTYLVDYRRASSETVTVWLDGYAEASYEPEQRLQPFLELAARLDLERETAGWQGETRQLLYDGSRYFPYGAGQNFLLAEDGSQTAAQGGVFGYEVSLWNPESPRDSAGIAQGTEVKRFFAAWDAAGSGTAALTGEAAAEAGQAAEPESGTGSGTGAGSGDGTKPGGGSNGTADMPVGESFVESGEDIAFFLDSQTGWCLRVADAAAGSRFFQLERTNDGGETWELWNEDPFAGATGGGVDLEFLDENLGFLVIRSASGSYAHLYRTEDGGKTVAEVELPTQDEAYDFPELPVPAEGGLELTVGKGTESDGPQDTVRLYSQDQGQSWTYR